LLNLPKGEPLAEPKSKASKGNMAKEACRSLVDKAKNEEGRNLF